jgi:hypothetical protein
VIFAKEKLVGLDFERWASNKNYYEGLNLGIEGYCENISMYKQKLGRLVGVKT